MALAAYQNWAVDEVGDVQPGAQIEVRREDNGALPQLYADRDGATPLGNPITADSEGFFRFYVVGSAYKITISFGETEAVLRHVGIGRASETDTMQSSVGIDPGFAFRFSDDVADVDPGTGFIGGDSADMSAITEFRISKTDRFGNFHEASLLALADSTNPIVKGEATLARNSDGLSAKYQLLGVTDDVGFVRVQVAYRSGAESGLSLGDLVSFQSVAVGDVGIGGSAYAVAFNFAGDGTTVDFDLVAFGVSSIVTGARVLWFEDGIAQEYGVDFTTSGSVVTRTTAPLAGAVIFGIIIGDVNFISIVVPDPKMKGGYSASGVRAINYSSAQTTTMKMNADYLTLLNPSDGSTKTIVSPTADLLCSISTTGAGGRDGAPAYVAADDVWWYWIWGSAAGLSTINSKSKPKVGPTLPLGYTHYCPAFPLKIFTGPTIQPTLPQGGSSTFEVCENEVQYLNCPDLIGAGYPTMAFNLSGYIPADAHLSQFGFDPELHAGFGNVIGGAVLSSPDGNFKNSSLYPIEGRWYANNQTVRTRLPANRQFTVTFLISSGTPDSATCDIFVEGYTFAR